jgi:hypothetical protein
VAARYGLLAAVAAVLVLATPAFAQAPTGDSAIGTVFDSSGNAGRVDAHSGHSGENPTGTALFGTPDSPLAPRWDLDVTCLSVTGHTAIVGFTGTLFDPLIGFGEAFPTAGLILAVDGGGPDSGLDSLEFSSVEGPGGGPPIPGPTTCSSYPGAFPGPRGPLHNDQGDLVVVDAAALPTSKDQCKDGGWRQWDRFRNQGECVSFVARGG